MLIVLSVAAAAALIVVAYYSKLRQHSPETGTAGLRAVHDLADVLMVCVKAVEGVVDVLARSSRLSSGTPSRRWDYGAEYGGFDLEEEEL